MLSPEEFERWRALARYDAEIRVAVENLEAYGDVWVFEFARAFFALGEDRSYIDRIYGRLIEEAKLNYKLKLEQARAKEELESLSEFKVASDGQLVSAESLTILKKALEAGYRISIDEKKVISACAPNSAGQSFFYRDYDIRRFGRLCKFEA